MANTSNIYVPYEISETLRAVGKILRRARAARRDTAKIAAQRLGVTRGTWARLEAGDPNVRMGTYLQAMSLYGLSERVLSLAERDEQTEALLLQARPKRGHVLRRTKADITRDTGPQT